MRIAPGQLPGANNFTREWLLNTAPLLWEFRTYEEECSFNSYHYEEILTRYAAIMTAGLLMSCEAALLKI
jgi:hypothetical protein